MGDPSFAETLQQYGSGGLFFFFLASAAAAAFLGSAGKAIESWVKGERNLRTLLLLPAMALIAAIPLCWYAIHIIDAKDNELRHAASLLNGKWGLGKDLTNGCVAVSEYEVNIRANTLAVQAPGKFTRTFEIDYIRKEFVQVHLRGGNDIRIFERSGNRLIEQDYNDQVVEHIAC